LVGARHIVHVSKVRVKPVEKENILANVAKVCMRPQTFTAMNIGTEMWEKRAAIYWKLAGC
jgi:hypothetical protein